MKGLILKDLYTLKQQGRITLLLAAFYLLYSFMTNNPGMFSILIIVISLLLPLTSVAYDEHYRWDRYALSMPVSRRTIVVSKYLLSVGLTILATIIVLIANVVFVSYFNLGDLDATIAGSLGVCMAALVFNAVLFPLLFKFGVQKARILLMIVGFIPLLVVVLGSKYFNIDLSGVDFERIIYFIPIIVLVLLVGSLLLSIKVYQKKEF